MLQKNCTGDWISCAKRSVIKTTGYENFVSNPI